MTSTKAPVSEADAFLTAHPDIASVELLLPDLNGILRGKRLSRRELAGLYRDGMTLPGTAILLDSRGSLIETLAAGLRDGDPDQVCRPVPGTLVPVPWAARPLGQCLLTMETRQGQPYYADTRALLAGVVERFRELDLTPVVAVEYEFYLLEEVAGEHPRARRTRVPGTRRQVEGPRVYSLEDLHELDDFFAAVNAGAAAQGIPAAGIIAEYGAGQFEVNLHHEADALAACDHALLLRRLIRGTAARHGLAATFMAKPFGDLDGSGMHVHVSLRDSSGRNVFAGQGGEAVPEHLRHAVGGMLAAMPESLAIFAPNANSYRRLRPGCFAPIAGNWGPNHRHVAVRLPASNADNSRFEHRTAGADCNPYLAVAAILAAVHHGITRRVEPPPMVPEGTRIPDERELACRWEQALDDFDRGEILPAYFGAGFCRTYSAARRFEAEAYHAQVPGLDYDWYLGAV
jgi:glutamine synthetase